jgi:hypothetical protein
MSVTGTAVAAFEGITTRARWVLTHPNVRAMTVLGPNASPGYPNPTIGTVLDGLLHASVVRDASTGAVRLQPSTPAMQRLVDEQPAARQALDGVAQWLQARRAEGLPRGIAFATTNFELGAAMRVGELDDALRVRSTLAGSMKKPTVSLEVLGKHGAARTFQQLDHFALTADEKLFGVASGGHAILYGKAARPFVDAMHGRPVAPDDAWLAASILRHELGHARAMQHPARTALGPLDEALTERLARMDEDGIRDLLRGAGMPDGGSWPAAEQRVYDRELDLLGLYLRRAGHATTGEGDDVLRSLEHQEVSGYLAHRLLEGSTLAGNREAHESLKYALMGRFNPAKGWTTASVDEFLARNIPPAIFIAP